MHLSVRLLTSSISFSILKLIPVHFTEGSLLLLTGCLGINKWKGVFLTIDVWVSSEWCMCWFPSTTICYFFGCHQLSLVGVRTWLCPLHCSICPNSGSWRLWNEWYKMGSATLNLEQHVNNILNGEGMEVTAIDSAPEPLKAVVVRKTVCYIVSALIFNSKVSRIP